VILDRIRENKGKAEFATRDMVNDAINQTFSRTVLTGGATLATALILFWLGGTGIRPFAYTFLVGLIAGTASSVLIAAPLCYVARPKNVQ
jgi:preprotein translocase subunit SecF